MNKLCITTAVIILGCLCLVDGTKEQEERMRVAGYDIKKLDGDGVDTMLRVFFYTYMSTEITGEG